MTDKAQVGKKGEYLAAKFLFERGYKILEKNWRFRRSEIDIICEKENVLVFVEVKTKSYVTYGNPEESVDERKAAKVVEGAEEYVYQRDWQGDIQFDIVSIVLNGSQHKILHLEDAFY